MIKYENYILNENPLLKDCLTATYLLRSKTKNILDTAAAMASEQTVGTWVSVPGITREMLRRYAGKVLDIWEIPDIENTNSRENELRTFIVQLAYPWKNFGGQIPMILTTVFGNISMTGDIKLLDLSFPKDLTDSLPGPQFGIAGIRSMLKIPHRPLLNTMIKPSTGISPEQGASLLYKAAFGGADIIKDDEVLSDTDFSPALKRVELYMKQLRQAEKETGEKKVYLVNCTAETDEMLKRIKFVEEHGGNYIMLDILTLGWAALQTARKHTKLPIHAHRAGHAMLDRDKTYGMSMEVIAQFARMVGVDTLHIGTAYGKMSGGKDIVLHIEEEMEHQFTRQTKENLSQRWFGVKPVFGVASGGVHPGIVPQIMKFMGVDVVIQAGGGIHGHPDGTVAGAIAMRQAVDATLNGISLRKYAKDHTELRKALEKWE